jgi:zinc/manganese transport system substrate-binding protein
VAFPAVAKKKVAATIPAVEALVREIGGDKVDVFSLAAGDQDPHFVSPTPVLMKKVREADLLVEVGMQLEIWADEVANGSGNARIFRGAPGRVVLSTGIPKLEVPSVVSRSEGDVHPEGNPHIWLDPIRAKLMGRNLCKALKIASPPDAAFFEARLKDFEKRIDRALFGDRLLEVVGSAKLSRLTLDGRLHEYLEANSFEGKKLSELAGGWLARARPLRGQKVLEFHKVWSYFAATFGFQLVGTIEEKPGIAPGPQHVKATVAKGKVNGVKLILVDNFYDPGLPRRVAREIGAARVVVVPNQPRGDKAVTDFFSLYEHLLGKMTAAK